MKKVIWAVVVVIILLGGLVLYDKNAEKSGSMLPTGNTPDMVDDMQNIKPTGIPTGWNVPVENSKAPVKEFTVEGKNFSFSLKEIRVKKGDLVKITFQNIQGFHDLVIDEFQVATKQIRSGEQDMVSFLADKVGSFEYYCSVGTHRALGMWGTLIVEE